MMDLEMERLLKNDYPEKLTKDNPELNGNNETSESEEALNQAMREVARLKGAYELLKGSYELKDKQVKTLNENCKGLEKKVHELTVSLNKERKKADTFKKAIMGKNAIVANVEISNRESYNKGRRITEDRMNKKLARYKDSVESKDSVSRVKQRNILTNTILIVLAVAMLLAIILPTPLVWIIIVLAMIANVLYNVVLKPRWNNTNE